MTKVIPVGPLHPFDSKGSHVVLLQQVSKELPANINPYVIGGAARNAVYYSIFKKSLPQRDFDLLVNHKDSEQFIQVCRSLKFAYGRIRRKDEIVVRKPIRPKPEFIADYLVFDTHISHEDDVMENLRQNSAFTINGFALPFKEFPDVKNLIALPRSYEDLKHKQLRLNKAGYNKHSGNLFACLRFMAAGFAPPPKDEVELLLQSLPKLEAWRFETNVQKVFNYVGGEAKARALVEQLGIQADIFSLNTVLKNAY